MPGWVKFAIVIVLICGVAYFGYGKFKMAHMQGGMPGMGGPATVDVAEVAQKKIQLWNEFEGRLTAVDQAEVRPRVSGPIISVNFKDGASVTKDELLFVIDPAPYKAEADRLQGQLGSAQAQMALAKVEFDRAQKLFASKAISQSDFDTRTNNLNVADAAVKSAAAALEAANLNLDYTQVKAPISGRASRDEVTVGNVVQAGAGAPVLTTIESINPIYADFDMDEATYLRYSAASADERAKVPVELGLATEKGTPHSCRIESFDNRLDPSSGTIRVRAECENPQDTLVPGLFARIRIADAGKSDVILVNDRAIGTDQDNKAEYRQVKLGPSAEGLRVVEDGLKPGDKVIISGLLLTMRPGMPVVPNMVAMDAPPSPPPGQAPPENAGGDKKDDAKDNSKDGKK